MNINKQFLHNLSFKNSPFHNMLGENTQWWKKNSISSVFGNNWRALTDLGTEPVKHIFEASDGAVYISTTSKIFKTTNLIDFTEMTLVGTRSGTFGNLVEISSNRIVCADRYAVWIKPDGSDTFTRKTTTTWTNLQDTNLAIGGHPGSNQVIIFTSAGAAAQRLAVYNADTDIQIYGWGYFNPEYYAYAPYMFPIRANNGEWILTLRLGEVSIAKFNGSAISNILTMNVYNAAEKAIMYHETDSGLLYLIAQKNSTQSAIIESSDNGNTWTSEVLVNTPPLSSYKKGISLANNICLISFDNEIYRSTNKLINRTLAYTASESINAFGLLSNGKIIAGGINGALFISES